jgi:predicted ester cyclase
MDVNEAIVWRYVDEVVNENHLAVIDEIFTADYVNHTPSGDLHGRDAMKAFIGRVRAMLPDVRATVHDMFAANDRVAVRLALTGAYHGEVLGVAYHGVPITLVEMQIYRLVDAKIAERWFIVDWRTVWHQLGAIR